MPDFSGICDVCIWCINAGTSRISATSPVPRMLDPLMPLTWLKIFESGLMTVWASPSKGVHDKTAFASGIFDDDDVLARPGTAGYIKELSQTDEGQDLTAQVGVVMLTFAREFDALFDHVQWYDKNRAAYADLEAIDDGECHGQAKMRSVVPWAGRLSSSISPRRASMPRLTTSIPTPRPEMLVTCSAVEKVLAEKIW